MDLRLQVTLLLLRQVRNIRVARAPVVGLSHDLENKASSSWKNDDVVPVREAFFSFPTLFERKKMVRLRV